MKYHLITLLAMAVLAAGCNQTASPTPPSTQAEATPPAAAAPAPAAAPAAAAPAPAAAPAAAALAPAAAPAAAAPAASSTYVPPSVKSVSAAERSDINSRGTGSRWQANAEQVNQRLGFVGKLLDDSSGAAKVKASGNPAAAELHAQAKDHYAKAKAASQGGDYQTASDQLSAASNTMFKAIQTADGGASKKEKEKTDYEKRMESVKVLIDAHNRIAKEKNLGSQGNQTAAQIDGLVGESQRLAAAGNYVDGRVALDKAYVTAKLAIEKMRKGDTLVRSLNFASKEEEYHYEVDRNDTHKMLVNMLLNGQPAATVATAQKFVENSTGLRKEAEAMAQGGDFAGAVKKMEEATLELIKAIRGAGIYIPG